MTCESESEMIQVVNIQYLVSAVGFCWVGVLCTATIFFYQDKAGMTTPKSSQWFLVGRFEFGSIHETV